MARIRTVKPQFFRHRRLYAAEQEFDLPLRIAFAGLWTCADREGRFRWEPDELKLDCLPYDDVDFSRVLDALFTRGFIVRYTVGDREYGLIPGFKDHQVINNREADSAIPLPAENIDDLIKAKQENDASATRELRVTDLHKRKGREGNKEGKGTDIGTRANATRPSVDFEIFKKAFPKRKGSNPWKPAFVLYESAIKRGHDPEKINAAALAYARECERNGILETERVAQAMTWLRQERYNDYEELAAIIERAEKIVAMKTHVVSGTEAWDAWLKHLGRKSHQIDSRGGWYFDSEFPPGHVSKPRVEIESIPIPKMQAIQ